MTVQWRIAPMLPDPALREPDPVQVELVCLTEDCSRFGERAMVSLDLVAPGILARPNFVCADCLMELALVTEEETHG